MRILVVDDSEDWRDLTEAALLAEGYDEVLTAASAADAYAKLGVGLRTPSAQPAADLIVLDVVMPEVDGIEACARIRSDARYGDVPVIMVTAANDMDSLSSAFVAGATDYITKPFNRVELLARVRSALKIKAELDRRKSREGELTALMRSSFGSRDASRWIDPVTGLLVGAAAEAALATESQHGGDDRAVSVLALAIDRLDALAAARGKDVRVAVLAAVAQALPAVAAPLGVIAASYPDGVFVLIAPRLRAAAARTLGEALRASVAALRIANPEAVASSGATLSIGIVSSRRARTELIADARRLVKEAAAAGGNRIAAADLSSH